MGHAPFIFKVALNARYGRIDDEEAGPESHSRSLNCVDRIDKGVKRGVPFADEPWDKVAKDNRI